MFSNDGHGWFPYPMKFKRRRNTGSPPKKLGRVSKKGSLWSDIKTYAKEHRVVLPYGRALA